MTIDFNRPKIAGNELENIRQAIANAHTAGDGNFTRRCNAWLEQRLNAPKALLTHSCTAALEMAALLFDLQLGDEVIMPSFTFVSTANAVVLRGALPVFVDIRPDTLNLDETLIEPAITPRTRAIFVVHYAGVGCAMDQIMDIADRHGLLVAEDAAQGLLASYRGKPLGGIGHLGAISFHETKNIISGEGGALIINDRRFIERAEIIREKGTNRSLFLRGEVDKYTWVDVGSSYFQATSWPPFSWRSSNRPIACSRNAAPSGSVTTRASLHLRTAGAAAVRSCRTTAITTPTFITSCFAMARRATQSSQAADNGDSRAIPLRAAARFARGRAVWENRGTAQKHRRPGGRLLRLPLWYGMSDEPERVVHAVRTILE